MHAHVSIMGFGGVCRDQHWCIQSYTMNYYCAHAQALHTVWAVDRQAACEALQLEKKKKDVSVEMGVSGMLIKTMGRM